MKIIIVGVGKVGLALTKHLSRENKVTIIDQNPQLVDNIINIYDVMGVCGNGASYDVQKEAEADKADLLIATASSDEINILTCLVAKKLGIPHTIARIRNPEYEKQLRFMREELGLSMSINPEKATAREIARVLRFPAAMKLESFSKGRLELVEYRLPENSALHGMRLSDLYRNIRVRVLICAVSRREETYIPSGDFVLQAGDKIYLTAAPHELELFFRHLGVFRGRASSVMIVGASKLCYYLASQLIDMGMSVKIVDQNRQRCVEMGERLPKALVIVGDGTDSELLQEEGISQTDAFVAITGLDEANILMSMSAARQSRDCKVVAKINRRSLMELVSTEGMIDSVVSTGAVTTELILKYIRAMKNATGSQVKTLHRIVDEKVEALEFGIKENYPFVGVPLRDLRIRSGILVAGIVRRSGRIVIPTGDDVINQGDDVIVVATDTEIQDIRDIFQ
ncbi:MULTISPECIES: Trk system potassium transporter TrkA [environmental samples]|jgi:trk system potassium uptake protein TrkA|uniref:Trk system potassium transporter TrkA n=1 Tax=environmental samples TaxID=876090 RepID=UPI00033AE758|nr:MULTISPECIES: Trk system potassium transporter TrkA [environmental samples]CDC72995.1 trk system potassium uptake protein TrkA [Oscillibacter sp. CAG:155]